MMKTTVRVAAAMVMGALGFLMVEGRAMADTYDELETMPWQEPSAAWAYASELPPAAPTTAPTTAPLSGDDVTELLQGTIPVRETTIKEAVPSDAATWVIAARKWSIDVRVARA